MRRPFCAPGRPPWWPHDAAWPPRRGAHQWNAGRARFFRRAAALFGLVLMLGVCGVIALVWLISSALGLTAGTGRAAPFVVLGAALVPIALAVLGLASVMRRVAMPIGRVMDAADRVAAGDYDVRLAEQGSPQIRALARSFNTMIDRLRSHDRLRRDMMADVAHELRTPLTVIQGKVEGLIDGVYPRDAEQLQQLLEETHVLARLVEDLRTLALSEGGALKLQKESTDLAELARDAAGSFDAQAAAGQVALRVDAPAELEPIEIDPVRIREVLTNLLSNALRHTPPGGSVTVRVAAPAEVEVRDTGTGMTPEAIARAFDRFFKGADSRGSGLGLAIAKALVAAHGGEIHASSEAGRGTTVAFSITGSSRPDA